MTVVFYNGFYVQPLMVPALHGAKWVVVFVGVRRYVGRSGRFVGTLRSARRWDTENDALAFLQGRTTPRRSYEEVCATKIKGWF